jgi:hypothetical protein
MKRFSQFKLTKGLLVLFTLGVILILYSAFPDYYSALQVQAQLQQQQPPPPPPRMGIKITSPTTGQQVSLGELTISGISTDNATTDCTVYADWNDTKPFQTATATGPGGVNDYSRWTFTYTDDYHLITNGTNNLTSKLSCVDDDSNVGTTANLTKSYSVNVIGITESSERQGLDEEGEQQNNGSSSDFSSPPSFPSVTRGNDDNNNTAASATPPPPQDPTIYWDLEDFGEDNNHAPNFEDIYRISNES